MAILTAVSSSVQQLHRLLRCLSFTSKAQVRISDSGLAFSVEDSRAMQASVILEKEMFTSYRYDGPRKVTEDEHGDFHPPELPVFEISLIALLETLSIFGATDTSKGRFIRDPYTSGISNARGNTSAAFDNRTLGLSGVCRVTYKELGDPLNITLEEGNMTTTCSLTTYEPATITSDEYEIPFMRDRVDLRIVMQASALFDAVQELHNTTQPERVTISYSPNSSKAAFSLSADGAFGSASIDFANEEDLLPTYWCSGNGRQIYKFSHIKAAGRAMSMAHKVSVRIDMQGVLNLQFDILLGAGIGGGDEKHSFVEFRVVPLLDEDEGSDTDTDAGTSTQATARS